MGTSVEKGWRREESCELAKERVYKSLYEDTMINVSGRRKRCPSRLKKQEKLQWGKASEVEV